MFIAKLYGKTISANKVSEDYTKQFKSTSDLIFTEPFSDSKVFFISSGRGKRSAHFRRQLINEHIKTKYGNRGEGKLHLECKMLVQEQLVNKGLVAIDEDYKSFDAVRIPDISVFSDVDLLTVVQVHEIQLSKQTLNQIIDRTDFYNDNKVKEIHWYFNFSDNWWKQNTDIFSFLDDYEGVFIHSLKIKKDVQY